MQVTHVPLGLQKQKDFQTLQEQVNKMVYSFNRFESSFPSTGSIKTCIFLLCSMHNFMIQFILHFDFLNTHGCVNKSGFLLRRSHYFITVNSRHCFAPMHILEHRITHLLLDRPKIGCSYLSYNRDF